MLNKFLNFSSRIPRLPKYTAVYIYEKKNVLFQDILENDDLQLDDLFTASLISDILRVRIRK